MNIETFSINSIKEDARIKWKEYTEARKKSNDKTYADLAKVYNQIKNGRKVIEIGNVLQRGGLNPSTMLPALAIAPALFNKVFCKYDKNGNAAYRTRNNWHDDKNTIKTTYSPISTNTLLKYGAKNFQNASLDWCGLECMIPKIPAAILPDKITEKHFILWEVEKWDLTPDRDPYLLERLTPNMFVILAGWDLTDLEIAVMKGRVN